MSILTNISIHDVQVLLEDLEAGDVIAAAAQLDKLTHMREHELYTELGKMTRNLHETLKSVDDIELMQQVKHDLPDISERLNYVMESTEEASAKTLGASENLAAILAQMETLMQQIPAESAEEFKPLLEQASNEVTNIMMTQSYQDLTGQVLNRIMIVVGAFEHSLVDLITRSGHSLEQVPERKVNEHDNELKGIGPNVTKSSQKDAMKSQDDVDDLLADLGF